MVRPSSTAIGPASICGAADEHRRADPCRGRELAYDEAGSGQSLVLVHGTGADASTWQRSATDLATHYRVIAYDRRSYGRSTHRPVRDYHVHVADLAAVLKHVGAPAHVLGWSSGGNTDSPWRPSSRSCSGH